MIDERNLQGGLTSHALDKTQKGLGDWPDSSPSWPIDRVVEVGWNLLNEDISLPVAVLSEARLHHNLAWMETFIRHYGLKLAPHGKTTMSPALFHRQLAQGAWGITLATAPQVQAAHNFGIKRVILANQLVGLANMAIISRLLRDAEFNCYVLVDCPQNTVRLGEFFAEAGQSLKVLVELGVAGGRSGVRDQASLEQLLNVIADWPQSLQLAGIEVYEGVLNNEADIRTFLHRAAETLKELNQRQLLTAETPLLTGAGSAWFDLVAEAWANLDIGRPLDIVLRPGCYLTHDVGSYQAAAERMAITNPVAHAMQSSLLPALQIWAYVISRPEPTLAILGLGKRDAAFDAGLPVPNLFFRPEHMDAPTPAPNTWQVTRMMDQHAFMSVPADAEVQVGDMLALDISHPCLTFDKWRQVLIINDQYQVVDAVQTFF